MFPVFPRFGKNVGPMYRYVAKEKKRRGRRKEGNVFIDFGVERQTPGMTSRGKTDPSKGDNFPPYQLLENWYFMLPMS